MVIIFFFDSSNQSKLSHLIDVQWAVVVAEATFKLLDPKESRALEILGLRIDPENPKTPLFYRLECAARREMVREALGQNGVAGTTGMAGRMVRRFELDAGAPAHVRAVEATFMIK